MNNLDHKILKYISNSLQLLVLTDLLLTLYDLPIIKTVATQCSADWLKGTSLILHIKFSLVIKERLPLLQELYNVVCGSDGA